MLKTRIGNECAERTNQEVSEIFLTGDRTTIRRVLPDDASAQFQRHLRCVLQSAPRNILYLRVGILRQSTATSAHRLEIFAESHLRVPQGLQGEQAVPFVRDEQYQ